MAAGVQLRNHRATRPPAGARAGRQHPGGLRSSCRDSRGRERGPPSAHLGLARPLTGRAAQLSAGVMRGWRQAWMHWQGQRIHPVRAAIELLASIWALWPISILFSVFLARLSYPMDLEWCEGGILYQAYRLLHGLPVYVRDDPVWTPWPYPIGHTLVLALIGLIKCDFWSGRLVSIFFFGLLCWSLFREVYLHLERSSYGIAMGLLSVAIVACAYPVVGQWYDLIRVDTMAIALAVIGIARVGHRLSTRRDIVVTAAVLTAAVFAKQTSFFFVAWACAFAFVRQPRAGLKLSVVTGALCLGFLAVLQWSTDGRYWYFTFTALQGHQVEDARLVDGLRQVWPFAPYVLMLPFGFMFLAFRGLRSQRTILWSGSLLMAIPAALLPYAKVGGFLNNLIPMVVLLSLTTTFVLADLARGASRLATASRWGGLVALMAFIGQRPLQPSQYTPTPADYRAARELNALVTRLPGGVISPDLGFLPARTGHSNPHFYTMAMWDAIWSGRPKNMAVAVDNTEARWALMHSKAGDDFSAYIRRKFRFARKVPPTARVRMLTGAPVILDDIWERPLPGSFPVEP